MSIDREASPQPATTWTAVGASSDWQTDRGRTVQVGKKRIAVFHHADAWYAVDELCPHERVGLANGRLKDGQVTCPGHGWSFRLADGSVVLGPGAARIGTYPVRIRDGIVEIG